jgi:hypothetical protein
MILRAIKHALLAWMLLMPVAAVAQAPTATGSSDQLLKPEELDALVAPIALYPDTLLAQVLMASTYPLEVVQADRWVSDNKNLKGDALKDAVEKQSWDDSVKGLVVTPSVLSMMSGKLDWTQKLGDAVLAQQPDVMDAIQRLRQRAQANNKLQSNKQQTVSVTQQGSRQVIAIQPADPSTIYVPYYDPGVVYGSWPYPAYPPYYWGYPGYIGAGVIATGLAFGAGYALGRWASGGGCCWGGGSFNWNQNNINIGNGNRATAWQHNPQHRQGVRYNNRDVSNRFGGGNRVNAQNRMDFRGRGGNQVLNPGGDRGNRGNVGDRGGNRQAGDRGGNRQAGDRGGNRQAGNRGGGNRQAGNRGGGNRQAGNRGGGNRQAGNRGGGSRGGGNAFSGAGRGGGGAARASAARGRQSMGGGGGRMAGGGGGGARMGGGGGGRGGGGGGRGGGGGGRRSDIALKHDIVLLGHLDNGLGFYRFSYNGSHKAYVGVIA